MCRRKMNYNFELLLKVLAKLLNLENTDSLNFHTAETSEGILKHSSLM